jgi:hypothetical protein
MAHEVCFDSAVAVDILHMYYPFRNLHSLCQKGLYYEVNKIMPVEYFKLLYSQNDKQMWGFIIITITIGFIKNLAFIALWGE